jgi:hypothetical protein
MEHSSATGGSGWARINNIFTQGTALRLAIIEFGRQH